jgi:hypothetical protein
VNDARWEAVLNSLGTAIEKKYRGQHPDRIRQFPGFKPMLDDPRFVAVLNKLQS